MMLDFAFFLATHNRLSRCLNTSAKKLTPKSGNSKGWPSRGDSEGSGDALSTTEQ